MGLMGLPHRHVICTCRACAVVDTDEPGRFFGAMFIEDIESLDMIFPEPRAEPLDEFLQRVCSIGFAAEKILCAVRQRLDVLGLNTDFIY